MSMSSGMSHRGGHGVPPLQGNHPSRRSYTSSQQFGFTKEASRMSSFRYVCSLAVIALCVLSATAQRNAGNLKIKPYVFENGQGEKVDAELGVLLVPENRSDPQSNLIELAF